MRIQELLLFVMPLICYAKSFSVPIYINKVAYSPSKLNRLPSPDVAITDFQRLSFQQQQQFNYQLYVQLISNGENFSFNMPLTVNGIEYNMTIDTGSSDFIIKGEQTAGVPLVRYKSAQGYSHKKMYQIKYSSAELLTYKQQSLNIQINEISFDSPVLIAYNATYFNTTQGLIGLSYPQLASLRPTFIQNLINNNIIDKYAFGVHLVMFKPARSFIVFGQPNPEYFVGDIKIHKIMRKKGAILQFQEVTIGKGEIMRLKRVLTYIDTGSTTMSFPVQYKQILQDSLNSANNICKYYVYPPQPKFQILLCKVRNFDQLPPIQLKIQNEVYTLYKQNYLRSCAIKSKDQRKGQTVYYCQTFLKVTVNVRSRLLLGSPFFSRYFTHFDLDRSEIGLAINSQQVTLNQILSLKARYRKKIFSVFDQPTPIIRNQTAETQRPKQQKIEPKQQVNQDEKNNTGEVKQPIEQRQVKYNVTENTKNQSQFVVVLNGSNTYQNYLNLNNLINLYKKQIQSQALNNLNQYPFSSDQSKADDAVLNINNRVKTDSEDNNKQTALPIQNIRKQANNQQQNIVTKQSGQDGRQSQVKIQDRGQMQTQTQRLNKQEQQYDQKLDDWFYFALTQEQQQPQQQQLQDQQQNLSWFQDQI